MTEPQVSARRELDLPPASAVDAAGWACTGAAESPALEIITTIRAFAEGREVVRRQGRFDGSERFARLVSRPPLADCAPGADVLRIEARCAGARESVSRELTCRVVDVAR